MRHFTITIRQNGRPKKLDVIAHSTLEAMLAVRHCIPRGTLFSISGRPA